MMRNLAVFLVLPFMLIAGCSYFQPAPRRGISPKDVSEPEAVGTKSAPEPTNIQSPPSDQPKSDADLSSTFEDSIVGSGLEDTVGWKPPEEMPAAERDVMAPQSGILHAMTKDDVRAMALVIRDFLGAPYVWGGSSVEGTDCSGFVCAVFRDALGIGLPRSAAEMYNFGMVISDDSLQFADLVFLRESSESGITHVGIYIAQGKFVHASPTKGVMISSLHDEFHRDHYAGARRIVGRATSHY